MLLLLFVVGQTWAGGPLPAEKLVAPAQPAVPPHLPDLATFDVNGNKLHDALEARLEAYESSIIEAEEGLRPADEQINLELIFSVQITQAQLDNFVKLGGQVSHIYRSVSYGWTATLPLSRLRAAVQAAGPALIGVVEIRPIRWHLDIATRSGRIRPHVWDSGFDGDPSITIAIVDSGLDDSHADLAGRMAYWMDYTTDASANPESVVAHGTHVAGIALGTGVSSGVDPSVITYTDQGAFPSLNGSFFPSVHEIPVQVTQFDWTTHMIWETAGPAVARIGHTVSDGSGFALLNSTTDGGDSPLVEVNNNIVNPLSGFLNLYSSFPSSSRVAGGRPYSAANTITADVSSFGVGDNYALFRGVAPECRWAGGKVFTNAGSGNTGFIGAAIDDMVTQRVAHNIKVLNMSLGLTVAGQEDPTIRAKTNTAVDSGIVVCISMGNDGPNGETTDPGRTGKALTVGATNDNNQLTDYTSTWIDTPDATEDYKPDVLAPGGSLTVAASQIMSTDTNDVDADTIGFADQVPNDYLNISGTSMASPFAAGCAALIIDAWQTSGHTWDFTSSSDPLFVKMLMLAAATETNQTREGGSNSPTLERASANGTTGSNKDTKEGFGIINPDASIEALTTPFVTPLAGSLGSGRADRRSTGRYVNATSGVQILLELTDMSNGDYDLYLYDSIPDAKGNPLILASSTNAGVNVNESIAFVPAATRRAYIFVKRVSGEGSFVLSDTAACTGPTAQCQSITSPLTGGSVTVLASEIDDGSSPGGDCTLTGFEIKKTDGGVFGASVTFGCSETGPQNITMRISQDDGQADECITVIIVEDPDGDNDGVGNCADICPNTIPGATVDADGCPSPPIPADFDNDGDVDEYDLDAFEACASGPAVPFAPGCEEKDFDNDGDGDQSDFGIFQRCFRGEDVLADPTCAD